MNKKLILIIGLVIIAGVGYGIFISSNKEPEESTRQVVGDTSTAGGTGQTDTQTTAAGREFVTQLLAIQSIRFNLDFFNDPVFRNLQDFSQVIEKQPIGRPNPFAPIGDFGTPVSGGTTIETDTSTTSTTVSTRPATGAPASTGSTGSSATTRTTGSTAVSRPTTTQVPAKQTPPASAPADFPEGDFNLDE